MRVKGQGQEQNSTKRPFFFWNDLNFLKQPKFLHFHETSKKKSRPCGCRYIYSFRSYVHQLSDFFYWGPHYRWLRISASTVWFPAQSTCLYWEHITRTLALMSLFPSLLMNNIVNCALNICLTVHLPRYHCNEKELLNMSHVMLQQLGFFQERTRFPRYNLWQSSVVMKNDNAYRQIIYTWVILPGNARFSEIYSLWIVPNSSSYSKS